MNRGASYSNGTIVYNLLDGHTVAVDANTGVELSANPHYWGGNVPIQHISIKFFSDENSQALAFRAGEIDHLPWDDGSMDAVVSSSAFGGV